jgi:hypothetical protein
MIAKLPVLDEMRSNKSAIGPNAKCHDVRATVVIRYKADTPRTSPKDRVWPLTYIACLV